MGNIASFHPTSTTAVRNKTDSSGPAAGCSFQARFEVAHPFVRIAVSGFVRGTVLNRIVSLQNCELLPPTDGDEIQPVDLLNSNSRDSTGPDSSNSDSRDSNSQTRTKLGKKTFSKNLEGRLSLAVGSNAQRKSSTESESGLKRNGLLKKKFNDVEPIEISSPGGDDSNDKSNQSASGDSTDVHSSTKQSQIGTSLNEHLLGGGFQTSRQNKSNGAVELPKSNGTTPMIHSPAPASKRRYLEDSDEDTSSEAPRKRVNEEQKSQARVSSLSLLWERSGSFQFRP